METIKCRPILVESKDYVEGNIGLHIADNSLQIMQRKILGNKFFDTKDGSPAHGIVIPQQLIIISLENDNIEVGDMIYNKFNNSTFNHIHIQSTKHTDISDKKVIATQSQIPESYIQQFIEEYNINSVKDIDIEMETMNKGYNKPEDYPFQEIAIPKLTNGFITIVKERLFNQSDIDKLGIKLPNINSSEEAILYTEEETKDLCKKILWDYIKGIVMVKNSDFDDKLISSINYCEKTNINTWFEQNKKK